MSSTALAITLRPVAEALARSFEAFLPRATNRGAVRLEVARLRGLPMTDKPRPTRDLLRPKLLRAAKGNEDAVQAALVQGLEAGFLDRAAWLTTATKRRAIDAARQEHNRKRREGTFAMDACFGRPELVGGQRIEGLTRGDPLAQPTLIGERWGSGRSQDDE